MSVLIIWCFHICKLAYSLKLICNPQINILAHLWLFADIHRGAKNLNHLMYTFLPEVEQGNTLPSCFSCHAVNRCPLCGLFSTMFFAFLCFLLVILLCKMFPNVVLKCFLVLISTRRL